MLQFAVVQTMGGGEVTGPKSHRCQDSTVFDITDVHHYQLSSTDVG